MAFVFVDGEVVVADVDEVVDAMSVVVVLMQ